jgi:hypothetical protein
MKYLLLLILTGCAGTDLKPDEFHVTYGQGTSDGSVGARESDTFNEFGSVGWTWHIGDVEQREHEDAYMEALYRAPEAAPSPRVQVEPVAAVEPESKPEPTKESGAPWWAVYVPAGSTLLLTVVGYLNKRGKVTWVSPKEHA